MRHRPPATQTPAKSTMTSTIKSFRPSYQKIKAQRAYDYHNWQNVNMNSFHVTSISKEPFKSVVDGNMDDVKL